MIYLVTKNQELFESSLYKHISVKESLNLMKDWKVIQLDTETTGRDAHVNDFLLVQMGNDKANARIEIDTSTIDIRKYKDKLENTLCILQNAKFDLQFFYNYGIIIRKVYDIMIVEQFLHLGYPSGLILSKEEYLRRKCNYPYHIIFNKETGKESYQLSYALDAIAKNRLNIDIDKTIRSQIIWRGLDDAVIKYGAGDVTYLEKLMWSQVEDLKRFLMQ